MIYKISINTDFEVTKLEDLEKLKVIMEVNKLGIPNFSKIGRDLGVDRRTVKKYYNGEHNIPRKKKASTIDTYFETISNLLSASNKQIFYYKSHLYRFLVREYGLNCSRSNFNHYILNNKDFVEYFAPKGNSNAVKTETEFGKQAQFDWKEKIKFSFTNGDIMEINVGSLILSASRFKVWTVTPSTNQNHLFDFLSNAFEAINGVPKELIIDNATTMMDKARTESSPGKVNTKFKQFSEDYGFKIVSCVRSRPQTKAKVENPMRIIDEIMNYNGILNNFEELNEKMSLITNEANARVCQATGVPPILAFKKEKEHLLPLPGSKVCSLYKNEIMQVKVNPNALFPYKQQMYSVPADYIGKTVSIEAFDNNLYVHYNRKFIAMHHILDKKLNYLPNHHKTMIAETFSSTKEDMDSYTKNHFKELERFNEQLSSVVQEFTRVKTCSNTIKT